MSAPRAVIAAPLYSKASLLSAAAESILAQERRDFALLLVDDCSPDDTARVAEALAASDSRVTFHPAERRLGMAANWRRCVELARRLYPDAPYFAWGSDHDWWHPAWLAELVAALDARPDAVLAYPEIVRVDENDNVVKPAFQFETTRFGDPADRLRHVAFGMPAGSIVYGLYRIDALVRAGTFRGVMLPDRLLLTELAFGGPFVQVQRVLWHRRFAGLASRERQRAALFADSPPWHARLPPALVHAAVLLWFHGLRSPRGMRLWIAWLVANRRNELGRSWRRRVKKPTQRLLRRLRRRRHKRR